MPVRMRPEGDRSQKLGYQRQGYVVREVRMNREDVNISIPFTRVQWLDLLVERRLAEMTKNGMQVTHEYRDLLAINRILQDGIDTAMHNILANESA